MQENFINIYTSDIFKKILLKENLKFNNSKLVFNCHTTFKNQNKYNKKILISCENMHKFSLNFIKKYDYTVNFHPAYKNFRGIGGISRAIFNGENSINLITHKINEHFDHGTPYTLTKIKLKPNQSKESSNSLVQKVTLKNLRKLLIDIDKAKYNFFDSSIKFNWSKKLYLSSDLDKARNVKFSKIKNLDQMKRIILALIYDGRKIKLEINNNNYIISK